MPGMPPGRAIMSKSSSSTSPSRTSGTSTVPRLARTGPSTVPAVTTSIPARRSRSTVREQIHRGIKAYQRTLEQTPDNPNARLGLGRAFASLQRWDEARREFTRAVEVSPERFEARYELGVVLSRLGEFERALAELENALRIRPRDVRVLYELGAACGRLDRSAEAAEYLRKVLAIDPHHHRAAAGLRAIEERPGPAQPRPGR